MQPPPYNPVTDFNDDELNNRGGRSTVSTSALDTELAGVSLSINAIETNLALNQRDDGEIRDQRVKLFTLDAAVLKLITTFGGTIRGAWLTATAYAIKDVVTQSGNTYIAAVAHTSGVFATDLAAVRWVLVQLGAAPNAAGVTFSPTATIAATDVQSAINETDTENRALSAGYDATLRANLFDAVSAVLGLGMLRPNATLNYTVGTLGRHVADEFWNVCDFPWLATRDGVSDATASIQACINAATAAGKGWLIPGGVPFNVNSLVHPSKSHGRGDGYGKSILKQISGANDLMHLADPGSSSTFTSQVTIEDMTLQGTVLTDGFQEVLHLFFTQGCESLLIQRCEFRGWRGDAIYIGTGNERGQNPTQVRHNRSVCIRDCTFVGEAKANRNPISIIDCDGGWFENLAMSNFGRSDMPAGIDIEPDSGGGATFVASVAAGVMTVTSVSAGTLAVGMTVVGGGIAAGVTIASLGTGSGGTGTYNLSSSFALASTALSAGTGEASIVRNLMFMGVKVRDYATQAAFAINLPNNPARYTTPIWNINFIDCDAQDSNAAYGPAFSFISTTQQTRSSPELGVTLQGCSTLNVFQPFKEEGLRGITHRDNHWGLSTIAAEVGSATMNAIDTWFYGDHFHRVGYDNSAGGQAMIVRGVDGFYVMPTCTFDDFGKANKTYNVAIQLSSAANHANVWVLEPKASQPAANPNAFMVLRDGGVLNSGTIRYERPTLINIGGGVQGLQSFKHDYIPTDLTTVPTLQNSWVDFGGTRPPTVFWKSPDGFVHVRIALKNGTPLTAGSTILSMPAGFRVTSLQQFVIVGNNGGTLFPAYVQFEPTIGDLQIAATFPGATELNGHLIFKAEA